MEKLLREVNDILLAEKKSYKVAFKEIIKNGVSLDALCIEGLSCSPIMYIDRKEITHKAPDRIAKELMSFVEEHHIEFDIDLLMNESYIYAHVYPKVVAKEGNEFWIKKDELICSEFLDMYILYFVVVSEDKDRMSSFTLRTHHIETVGLDISRIKGAAIRNVRKNHYISFVPMVDILSEFLEEAENHYTPTMYVLSNKYRTNGAGVICCDDVLYDISERLNDDLIILPSSLHEVIIMPLGFFADTAALKDMVSSINESVVDPLDRLTNSVYIYDGSLRRLR